MDIGFVHAPHQSVLASEWQVLYRGGMQWSGQAIVVSTHPYSEQAAIIRLFSEEQGLFAGIVRGAYSRKQRPVYEPGNLVKAEWSARLAEHLGNLRCELLQPMAAYFMQDAARLLALQSAMALVEKTMAERDPHPAIYHALWALLQEMKFGGKWQESYVWLEMKLLAESGFGLELDRCAATGESDQLIYVSPKSGRAVSREAGAPYHERMLALPSFLNEALSIALVDEPLEATQACILNGLRLTGYFLEQRIFLPHGWLLPAARERLIVRLQAAVEEVRIGREVSMAAISKNEVAMAAEPSAVTTAILSEAEGGVAFAGA